MRHFFLHFKLHFHSFRVLIWRLCWKYCKSIVKGYGVCVVNYLDEMCPHVGILVPAISCNSVYGWAMLISVSFCSVIWNMPPSEAMACVWWLHLVFTFEDFSWRCQFWLIAYVTLIVEVICCMVNFCFIKVYLWANLIFFRQAVPSQPLTSPHVNVQFHPNVYTFIIV